jgi:hypothetical protein
MKTLFAFLLSCICASAAYNTITIVHTNIPATGDTITRGASAAIWTNGPFNTTSWIQTNGLAGSATNLTRFLAANHPAYYVRQQNSTNVLVSGADLTISITGTWGYLTTNSLAATNQWLVTLPFVQQFETNRTNTADELIYGLNAFARTGAFSAGAQALSNHFNRSTAQTGGNKTLTNSTFSVGIVTNSPLTNIPYANVSNLWAEVATIYQLANTLSNAVFWAPKMTNATGTLTNSALTGGTFQDASVSNVFAQDVFYIDVVNGTHASLLIDRTWNLAGTSTGDLFIENVDTGDVPVRFNPDTRFMNPVTVSNTLTVDRAFTSSNVTARTALIATNISAGGTNIIHGSLAFTSRDNTTLANGFNAAVVLGTNVDVRLSGPSGAYTNAGFALAPSGNTVYFLTIDNPGLSFALLHESGLDAAANRIITDTGAPLHSTNRTVRVILKRDESISRWTVFAFR